MKGITNKDIEPFVINLVDTMKDRNLTEDTIYRLLGIVFVQNVDSSALSVMVPLMLVGFRQNKSIIRRMCGRVVSNMVKLVEDPLDAAPFLDDLIPKIKESRDTVSRPEVRDVLSQTYEELLKMEKLVFTNRNKRGLRRTSVLHELITGSCINDDSQIEGVLEFERMVGSDSKLSHLSKLPI